MIDKLPIEIIGGGLAGLSLGLALRRSGVAVSIFEAGRFPRHRVCGEFIAGLDTDTVERLGIAPFLEGALSHAEVAWFLDRRAPEVRRLPAPARSISRFALDARLAEAFVAAGGSLHENTRITDPAPRPGRVFATGRVAGRSPWVGLKLHVRGLQLERGLEMHLGSDAYVGLARVADDTVNVCGLFRRRKAGAAARGAEGHPGRAEVLLEHLESSGLARLAQRLREGDIEEGSFCAVAGLFFGARPRNDGRAVIGDAFSMIPPFTGNGMSMAFQSAAEALEPLIGYAERRTSWDEARCATNAALRGRFRLRLLSANAVHAFLLREQRQRWLGRLSRAGLLPFRPLYAMMH